MSEAPRIEYSRRLEALRGDESRFEHRHRALGIATLFSGVAALILGILALWSRSASIVWPVLAVIGIAVFAVLNERAIRGRQRCRRAITFHERALARLDDRWMGTGETGDRFLEESHPYSRDLDLFGRGSLFELLCTARTQAGEETLARWLLHAADPAEVRRRQEAISDLRDRLDLREGLAVLGEDVRLGVHAEPLAAWGEGDPWLVPMLLRILLGALGVLWLVAAVAAIAWGQVLFLLVVTAVNFAISYQFRRHLDSAIPPIEDAAHDLELLSKVLARFESENFTAPKLVDLQGALRRQGMPPSRSIARLNRRTDLVDSRDQLAIKVIDPFIFWALQSTWAVEAWRKEFGSLIRQWLVAVGEMEALSSLASYAYENPADVFPEFSETTPCFDAQAFTHPLIPESRAIRNDLKLDSDLRLVIISGPNMAGKSTFIRAVGLNAVLAQCGAPVRAQRLRLSPLSIGASVCILDSLQGGISRFYAEIKRLKQISDLTQAPSSVLFLLDELLQGTNSHDRRIAAAAVVRNLVDQGAIGLITTHDLALTKIADSLAPLAANAHFEDRIENGLLFFDHRLRPGIVQTSNALDLMRSIGLDV
ncbi:MAG TPA: hypothetical protein VN610_09940 [Bryobacteraceae bacterium]|nr:hypothetical protein [Bryobacteraceae bacterium]